MENQIKKMSVSDFGLKKSDCLCYLGGRSEEEIIIIPKK